MPAGTIPRGIALAGLLAMIAALLLPIPTPWTSAVAVPLLAFSAAGLKPPRKWGGWLAAAMVPYFCISLAEVIANPMSRTVASLLAGCAMIVFFAALEFNRSTGVSLRD